MGDSNACEAVTTKERTTSYACYAIGDCNLGDAVATTERALSYACYAIGDYGIHTTLYQSNCCRFNNGIATLAAVIYTVFLIYNNACKAGATIERTNSYACYAVGYCNAFEAGAN